ERRRECVVRAVLLGFGPLFTGFGAFSFLLGFGALPIDVTEVFERVAHGVGRAGEFPGALGAASLRIAASGGGEGAGGMAKDLALATRGLVTEVAEAVEDTPEVAFDVCVVVPLGAGA